MTTTLRETLSSLARQRGVRGCLIVSEGDGILIDSTLHYGADGAALAALSSSLFRKARLAARAAGLGPVTFLRLEAAAAVLCVAGRDDLLLVALAGPGVNAGLIRVEMLKAVDGLT